MNDAPMNPDSVLLVGGGTGGHVYPMIAVADELRRLAPGVRLTFVGTERGIESQVVPERGYALELIAIEPIRGRGFRGALSGVRRAAASIPEARALLRRLGPKVVFSIGGYAAGPIALAARTIGIPVALMEPNTVIGLANRLTAPWVQRAYTCFADVERYFPSGSVWRTGLAIRRGFDAVDYGFDGERLRVLVLGGSQGATALNETLPRALAACKVPLSVVHQAGKGHDSRVRELYQSIGAAEAAEVVPFINDMPSALACADLVIGRSGAGAISEICAIGRPVVFIPYPYASGDHQYKNAASLVEHGAALCFRNEEATPERLARAIDELAADPARLGRMADAAQQLGRPDAAEAVALDLLDLGNVQVPGGDHDDGDFEEPSGDCSPAPSEVH
jgi:UDP-N-acetylglucosamine--N-acetylmuramyl-(pentapeptide) pyrophosphoryl-undecaprenol N-acetylglucosamine transferase